MMKSVQPSIHFKLVTPTFHKQHPTPHEHCWPFVRIIHPLFISLFYSQKACNLDHWCFSLLYGDVIMSAMAAQITSVSIVYSTVCSGAHQRNYQRSASLTFVRGIHRWHIRTNNRIVGESKRLDLMWRRCDVGRMLIPCVGCFYAS